jgi:hypothetical protein
MASRLQARLGLGQRNCLAERPRICHDCRRRDHTVAIGQSDGSIHSGGKTKIICVDDEPAHQEKSNKQVVSPMPPSGNPQTLLRAISGHPSGQGANSHFYNVELESISPRNDRPRNRLFPPGIPRGGRLSLRVPCDTASALSGSDLMVDLDDRCSRLSRSGAGPAHGARIDAHDAFVARSHRGWTWPSMARGILPVFKISVQESQRSGNARPVLKLRKGRIAPLMAPRLRAGDDQTNRSA